MTTTRYYRGVTQVTTDKKGRWYEWQGEKFYSVTTITKGALRSPGLENWGPKMTAIAAIKERRKVAALLADEELVWGDDGRPISPGGRAAYEFLTGYRFSIMEKKADLGTRVHDYAEAHVLGQPMPPMDEDMKPYVAQLIRFLDDHQPEFVAVEATALSREQRYAGRLDFIAHLPKLGKTVLGDYKTGRGIYPETALQLAAYRFADTFLGLPDTSEAPVPEVDGAVAIHLTPEQYAIIPVKADELAFRTFLYAREIYRWQLEGSKVAIGEPLSVGGDQLELWVTT